MKKTIPILVNNMIDWTEKYRPKNLDSLVIETQRQKRTKKIIDPKAEIIKWATSWTQGDPKKKAIVLSGKPGIGKTSCAYALAYQFHWVPIELNTSDARNKARIRSVATAGSQHQSFADDGSYISTKDKGRKLIILDEADNLYERSTSATTDGANLSDRGGKREIVHTVSITKQPIILIVNNYYNLVKGSGEALKRLCLHLELVPPSPSQIYKVLYQISKNEQIQVDKQVLQLLSTRSKGDIRSAIRDLQSLSIGEKEISIHNSVSLGFRDTEEEIFDVLASIFRGMDLKDIKNKVMHLNVDPQMLLYWINENIPRSYKNPVESRQAFDHASKADIYLSRTFRRSNYRLWAYATDHMTLGVSVSKHHPIGFRSLSYPTWLRKRKKNSAMQRKDSLVSQLSVYHHCSQKKIEQDLYPYIQRLLKTKAIDVDDLLEHEDKTSEDESIELNKQKEDKEESKQPSSQTKQQKTLFS